MNDTTPPPHNPHTYADSGVSISKGDAFAELAQRLMRQTHGPRVLDQHNAFAGMLRLDFNEQLFKRNYRDPVLVACTDGVGTKILLAKDTNNWSTVGQDLVAMNVNDLVVQGAEPLLFLDYIACHTVDHAVLAPVIESIARACKATECALLGGETAELNDLYKPGDIDLAGFAVGVLELERAIDTSRVEPGDIVIGLESDGAHSNGFSLIRKAIQHASLDINQPREELQGDTLAERLLTPTRLYAAPITRLLRKYKVKKVVSGMAHITGGGLADNLKRALHDTVDAHIDRNTYTPPPELTLLQNAAGIDNDEMHRVFNMGIGYTLIVRPSFAASITQHLTKLGERPRTIGEITKGTGRVINTA